MELFWWLIAMILFAVGLIGTVVPVIPGTTIILAAAVIHRVMVGPEKSIGWRAIGAIIGAVIGLFFGLIGLLVGPVIGAIAGEVISGKRMIDAGRAGWGSFLGNLGSMIGKLIIGLVMIVIFLGSADAILIALADDKKRFASR